MKKNNKENLIKGNDFEYEALLRSEGEKINNAKFDFQDPPRGFQESLKMKLLEKRQRKSTNMKKLFEVFQGIQLLFWCFWLFCLLEQILFFCQETATI